MKKNERPIIHSRIPCRTQIKLLTNKVTDLADHPASALAVHMHEPRAEARPESTANAQQQAVQNQNQQIRLTSEPISAPVGLPNKAAADIRNQLPAHQGSMPSVALATPPAALQNAALAGQVAAILKAIQQLRQQGRAQEQRLNHEQERSKVTAHQRIKREAMGRLLEKAANAEQDERTARTKSSVVGAKQDKVSADTQTETLGDASKATLQHIRDEIDAILQSRRVSSSAPQRAASQDVQKPATTRYAQAHRPVSALQHKLMSGASTAHSVQQPRALDNDSDNQDDDIKQAAPPQQRQAAAFSPVSSESELKNQLQQLRAEVRQLETKEQELLDGLPAAEERVKRAKAAVTDTEQTLAIARNRLVLARRAAEDAESSASEPVSPTLLQGEGAALEDEQRVADELQRQRGRLREAESVASEAPALARVLARRRKQLNAMEEKYTRIRLLDEAQTLEANKNFAA
jgi:hypothetical protein